MWCNCLLTRRSRRQYLTRSHTHTHTHHQANTWYRCYRNCARYTDDIVTKIHEHNCRLVVRTDVRCSGRSLCGRRTVTSRTLLRRRRSWLVSSFSLHKKTSTQSSRRRTVDFPNIYKLETRRGSTLSELPAAATATRPSDWADWFDGATSFQTRKTSPWSEVGSAMLSTRMKYEISPCSQHT